MRISAISFKGYDPYPVNGGKVEKLKYEVEHGMREPSDTFSSSSSDHEDCFRSRQEEQEWWARRDEMLSGYDDGDDW